MVNKCRSRLHVMLLLWILFSYGCQTHDRAATVSELTAPDTVSNALMDSLGEQAYAHYTAFDQQPEHFLAPIENKQLTDAQKETYVWILLNMAYSFQEHSRYLASTQYYEKALRYDKQYQLLQDEDRLTFIYKPLANNYTVLADYPKAERLQLQAIQETRSEESKASFYNNLSLLYVFNGEDEKAKEAALAGLQHCKVNNHLHARLHNTLSAAYVDIGRPDSARLYNSRAVRIAEMLPLNETTASVKSAALERLSQFQRIDKKEGQAQASLLEALTLEEHFFPNSHFREKANLLNLIGELHYTLDHFTRAKHYFLQAKTYSDSDHVSSRISSYTAISILENLGIVYSAENTDSAWHYFRQAIEADFAFQQSIRSRASHLRSNVYSRRIIEHVYRLVDAQNNMTQEQLRQLLWLTELTKGRLLWNEINRSALWEADSGLLHNEAMALQHLYTLRDQLIDTNEIAEINAKIKKLHSDFELEEQYFSRNIALPDFSTFTAQLSQQKGLTYSYYIHSDSTLSIFRTSADSLSYYRSADTSILDSIAQFKNSYFAESPASFNKNPEAYFQKAAYLCRQLLPQLPQKLSSRLQLSLDNELHVLPFDALYRQDRFIVQDYEVQYVHTLLMGQFYHPPAVNRQNISILYRDQYPSPMADLHFVDNEVHYITSHFSSNTYPYTALDRHALRTIFNSGDVIHIAAHTIIDEQQQARILLHQPVSVEQLRYYQLHAPLVVLSACNTASGQLLPAEGLASINRGFLSKGIPGVIATHWFANDQVTLDLTQRFYDQLQATKDPVQALANAKRQYLASASEMEANPWYWANMAYTGVHTKIDLHNRTGLLLKMGCLTIVLALLYGLFSMYRRRSRSAYPD